MKVASNIGFHRNFANVCLCLAKMSWKQTVAMQEGTGTSKHSTQPKLSAEQIIQTFSWHAPVSKKNIKHTKPLKEVSHWSLHKVGQICCQLLNHWLLAKKELLFFLQIDVPIVLAVQVPREHWIETQQTINLTLIPIVTWILCGNFWLHHAILKNLLLQEFCDTRSHF